MLIDSSTLSPAQRKIWWYVSEKQVRLGSFTAHLMGQEAALRAGRDPVYRREVETEMSWDVWVDEVQQELAIVVEQQQESNDRMAGHVCPDCGVVITDNSPTVYCFCDEQQWAEDDCI